MLRMFGLVLLLFALGCLGARQGGHSESLSETQALELAVALANAECKAKFAAEPFDVSSYPIRFIDGRWQWGKLDLAGPTGLSARVSFDAQGQSRRVEVFFSTDKVTPLRSSQDDRRQ